MARIKILPPLLVNQIAAGECIERPASVVKELVENSLDAGATHIEVNIEDAGNRLIRISDNGCGIPIAELPLAVTSHATSKLQSVEDLNNIHTLGFRGEALASIASVAELAMASATAETEVGYRVDCRNGNVSTPKPVGMPCGTIVEVRELFFNVPARRKFLRAKSTEMAHISDSMVRLALAAYAVSFRLTHNNRLVFAVAATDDPAVRIQELLCSETVQLVATQCRAGACHLQAYLALPQYSRSNNKWQHCYLNGRLIKDRTMLRALQDAYRDYLPAKRFAIAVLYLEMDPALVDVNVHPAKSEVRYRNSQEIYTLVYRTVLRCLSEQDLTAAIPLAPDRTSDKSSEEVQGDWLAEIAPGDKPQVPPAETASPHRHLSQDRPKAPPSQYRQNHQENSGEDHSSLRQPQPVDTAATLPANLVAAETVTQQWSDLEENAASQAQEPEDNDDVAIDEAGPGDAATMCSPASGYLQVHKSYLIYETSDGIAVVDQHALHERVLYERLRNELRKKKTICQPLLFAESYQLSAEEMQIFQRWQSCLRNIGIDAVPVDAHTVEVKGLPQILGKISAGDLLLELLENLDKTEEMRLEDALERMLATMACKAAVKAGEALTEQEISSLLRRQEGVDNPYHCPHGRPTTLRITLHDLEKHFKRK